MRKVLIVSSVVVVSVVALIQKNVINITVSQKGDLPTTTFVSSKEEVLSESDEVTVTSTPAPTDIQEEIPTDTPTRRTDKTLDKYIYDGAQISSQTDTHIIYSVSTDPGVVTDWMKEQIISEGYNVTSFVTTSANENVENKLVAANGKSKVSVTLTKNPDMDVTHVEAFLD